MPEIFRSRAAMRTNTLRTERRSSPRLRGYDAKWDRLSQVFRRRHPFCRFCDQTGERIVLCDVVDHVIPVVDDPTKLFEWSNLQSLCHMHHSGLKAWLEAEARDAGDIALLTRWCEDLESRPIRRGEARHGGCEAQD